jgi:hypothetical protein
MTTIRISDQPVSPDTVTFNERAMGKVAQAPQPMVLTALHKTFTERFAPVYAQAIEDLEADDRVTGKFSPPYAGATRYPTLDELFALPDAERMEMIGAFFTVDILRLFVAEAAAGACWAVRFVDSVTRRSDHIEVRGRVEKI